jgi:large subunit ribosomal protein L19
MNQEESKAEEPKSEEPVVEESKAEEPVAEEPKAEEPVAEEPKAEEPVAGEPKAEEPVAEEPVAEEPKAEEPKAEEPVAEEAVDYLSTRNVNNKIETFSSGDTVVLNLLIKEGERERVQAFQGNIIRGNHINGKKVLPGKSFTVRRMASGVGVERTLPLSSPSIDSLKVIRKGKVRQSKLYYLRDLTGKKARIKEAR